MSTIHTIDYKFYIADVELTDDIPGKCSFNSPYNSLKVSIVGIHMPDTSTYVEYFEGRLTKKDVDEPDIGIGTLLFNSYSIDHTASESNPIDFTYELSSSKLPDSYIDSETGRYDGTYTISLYTRNTNGIWDVTYLLFTIENNLFKPSDMDGFEILTEKDIPLA